MAAKGHRKKKAGRKATKRKDAEKKKVEGAIDEGIKGENPRAGQLHSKGRARVARARTAEKEQRRLHVPVVDYGVEEPPPFVVLVQGPPGVGKTTLIKCLIKHYTRQAVNDILGPITVVSGKKRRLTFVECPQDLCGMIDAAKYADLVLLLIDGEFGFEMETFEMLMLLQQHGMPKVMGVLTHLDGFKDNKKLKNTKKALKHRFWTEVAHGSKLFYLSGIKYGRYLKREVLNLARFISVAKVRPLSWRIAHPYLIADRFEDITPREQVHSNPKCDRTVTVYGFLRGCNLRAGQRMHIAGVDDFTVDDVDQFPDPCPMPETIKKRGLNEQERLIYAPMSNVGGLLYDKDAVYIDIPDWKLQYTLEGSVPNEMQEGEAMVRELQQTKRAVDESMEGAEIQIFRGGSVVRGDADFSEPGHDDDEDDEDEDDDEGDDDEHSDEDDDEDDDKDDEEDDEEERPSKLLPRGMPRSESKAADGRVRRAAVFDDVVPSGVHSDADDASDGDDDDDDGGFDMGDAAKRIQRAMRRQSSARGSDEEDDEEDDDEEDEEDDGNTARWRERMLAKQSALFSSRASDLKKLIYGERAVADNPPSGAGASRPSPRSNGDADAADDESDSDDEELFTLKRAAEGASGEGVSTSGRGLDAMDSSCIRFGGRIVQEWQSDEAIESIRNRIVTGDWEEGKRRAQATGQGDDEDELGGGSDDEDMGDFEDMETGEKFKTQLESSDDAVTKAAMKAIAATAAEERAEAIKAKRAAKKAAFDREYDELGRKGVKDGSTAALGSDDEDMEDEEEGGAEGAGARPGKGEPGQGKVKRKGLGWARGKDDDTYFDYLKKDLADRQAVTRQELDAMDPAQRAALEGYRPGAYLRIRLRAVPCELVEHFDPRNPMLVGGIGRGEEKVGFMHLRFKRHRWYPKILKTRDPLIFSSGWRRFQSIPVFSQEDHNQRHRALKYTPEHMHCRATIWGPLAPPGTGLVAVQNLSSGLAGWRISGTGVVMEVDAKFNVVKKLKLVGYPYKIQKHTAFISEMFTSQVEVAKFVGASIRTVSGIRGTIKKALRPGVNGAKEGSFRATFEDKPLMSDIIMLKAWVGVDVPRFYNPVTNLLVKAAPLAREPKTRKQMQRNAERGERALPPPPPPAALSAASQAALKAGSDFVSAERFMGAKPGYKFCVGHRGLGYYVDYGPNSGYAGMDAATGEPDAAGGAAAIADPEALVNQPGGESGWMGMRTVAQLRRVEGVGATRNADSLYKPIERAPRVFPALKVPISLQQNLPFKSKPKVEAPHKRKTLEQRRAVVMDSLEKKKYTLVQQLNAIRNEKAKKRREQKARGQAARAKKLAAEEQWRTQLNKDERKRRYQQQAAEEKRAAKKMRQE